MTSNTDKKELIAAVVQRLENETEVAESGCCYLVPTPIGHLADISLRALSILHSVDCIAAEDTRVTARLLNYYNIHSRLVSNHDHNEKERVTYLLSLLQQGLSLAVVSDAGMPLISDPGFPIVRALLEAGIRIIPIPGACAALTAAIASGISTSEFSFLGFAPSRPQERRQWIEQQKHRIESWIFYESKHRIKSVLADLLSVLGPEREICVAREITKQYETFYRGTLQNLAQNNFADVVERGEFVVLIQGAAQKPKQIDQLENIKREINSEELSQALQPLLSISDRSKLLSSLYKVPKNILYHLILNAEKDKT